MRLPSASYTAPSNSAWASALDDAAVDLTLDDERVDLVAAVVDRDVLHARSTPPVSSSTSTTHTWVPNGHEKLGGS